ncbi:hypothetical protein CN878_23375 [Ochrobactrum sp. 695/2009]|nr:hypothetical protein CN881_10535 [Ochrobactrum sp. 721/2009]PJT15069.1 hypothetical protein CN880_17340 [Ochrobactrum sp. 720/2009]PJT18096.1 hypothetical protein CN879_23545 [Ochrobactrum sp. 715/2009]PJT23026.1 hypothetical protein CN878_23375 [Ochrobactrum sp. 695/2009]PJT32684.1 hypothetical protein CN877_20680 [Ochrobactrum sp. 689/2009]
MQAQFMLLPDMVREAARMSDLSTAYGNAETSAIIPVGGSILRVGRRGDNSSASNTLEWL